MIEMAGVLSVMGLVTVGAATFMSQVTTQSRAELIANEAKVILSGANKYTAENFEALLSSTAISGVSITLHPSQIELQNLSYVQPTAKLVNSFGSAWDISLSKVCNNLTPTNSMAAKTVLDCDITVLVSSVDALVGKDGITPDYGLIGKFVNIFGSDAGYSSIDSPAIVQGETITQGIEIVGKDAGWHLPIPNLASGVTSVPGIIGVKSTFSSSNYSQFARQGETRALVINGALSLNGLNNTGNYNQVGNANISGDINQTGDLGIGDTQTTNGNSTISGSSSQNALTVIGGATVSGSTTTGTLNSSGGTGTTLNSVTAGDYAAINGVTIGGSGLTASGLSSLNAGVNVGGSWGNTGALNVGGIYTTGDITASSVVSSGTITTNGVNYTSATVSAGAACVPAYAKGDTMLSTDGKAVLACDGAIWSNKATYVQLSRVVVLDAACTDPLGTLARDAGGFLFSCAMEFGNKKWKSTSVVP